MVYLRLVDIGGDFYIKNDRSDNGFWMILLWN